MTERWYRLIQGVYLLVALYFENRLMIHGFIAMLLVEALSNVRLPAVISRLRYGKAAVGVNREESWSLLNINSERLLRVVVAGLLVLGCILFPELIWFFPWFVAAMLLLAGITNICPMVMMFRYIGFE